MISSWLARMSEILPTTLPFDEDLGLADDHDDGVARRLLGNRLAAAARPSRSARSRLSLVDVDEQEEHEHRQHVDHRHEVDLALGLVPVW